MSAVFMVADTKGGKGSLSTGKIEPAIGAQVRCLAPAKRPGTLQRETCGSHLESSSPASLPTDGERLSFDLFWASR
jgi:hypothetical protein